MIDQQTILVSILAAALFILRELTRSKVYVDRQRADGELVTEKSYAAALEVLAKIAERGLVVQEKATDIQQRLIIAVDSSTQAIRESAAELRGMNLMIDASTKRLGIVAIAVDEMSAQFPSIQTELHSITTITSTLKTDIDGSLAQQFGPIVSALTVIGVQLTNLVNAVQAKDTEINERLNTLIEDFKIAEGRLINGLKHIGEFAAVPVSSNHEIEPTKDQS